jgi:hypothetical protein
MKQKDIALIVVVGVISAIASLFLSNALITSPKSRQQKVEVVTPISSSFNTPDKKYFNSESIDPTKLIQIGDNTNTDPFKSSQ